MVSLEMPSGEMNQLPDVVPPENGKRATLDTMPFVMQLSPGDAEPSQTVKLTGQWLNWETLGGTCVSSPAVASWGEDRIDVFAIGTDSKLYHKYWSDRKWSNWIAFKDSTCIYKPAAVSWGKNRIDVFAIGIDKQVYQNSWTGSEWAGWQNLGGTCIHGVAATSWGEGRIDLFSVGTNSVIYHKYFADQKWTDWQLLKLQNQKDWEKSSTSLCAPAAVASKQGRIDLFTLGIDNYVYHAWGDGASWQGWQKIGGPATQGIAAASRGEDCLDVFTVSTDVDGVDNHLYRRVMQNGNWSNWENLGGVCVSAPAAVAVGANQLRTVVVGTRSALYQKAWTKDASSDGGVSAAGVEEPGPVIFTPATIAANPLKALNRWVLPPLGHLNPSGFKINLNASPRYWLFSGKKRDVIATIATLDQIYFGELPKDEYGYTPSRGIIGVQTYDPSDAEWKTIAEIIGGRSASVLTAPFSSAVYELYSTITDIAGILEIPAMIESLKPAQNITVFQVANSRDIDVDNQFSPIKIFWDQPSVTGVQAASVLAQYWSLKDKTIETVKEYIRGPAPSYQAVYHRLLKRDERLTV